VNIHSNYSNSVAFSSQANYTDWATATGRRILMPTFMDRGVSRGQRSGTPTAVNLSFLDRTIVITRYTNLFLFLPYALFPSFPISLYI
jgi:hypothetical protein